MSRKLDDLDPSFRPVVFELLARLTEQGLYVVIVDTLRTPEEHARNLAKGVSWAPHSRHLDGLAIDLCPVESYVAGRSKLRWDADAPGWQVIGAVGERLGLRWGGRWKQRDLGHLEWQP